MSGEELYVLFAETELANGVGMDEWEYLDPLEQIVWEQFADSVRQRLNV